MRSAQCSSVLRNLIKDFAFFVVETLHWYTNRVSITCWRYLPTYLPTDLPTYLWQQLIKRLLTSELSIIKKRLIRCRASVNKKSDCEDSLRTITRWQCIFINLKIWCLEQNNGLVVSRQGRKGKWRAKCILGLWRCKLLIRLKMTNVYVLGTYLPTFFLAYLGKTKPGQVACQNIWSNNHTLLLLWLPMVPTKVCM